jgi:Adenylate and Guanylate cyclase catalytic domain
MGQPPWGRDAVKGYAPTSIVDLLRANIWRPAVQVVSRRLANRDQRRLWRAPGRIKCGRIKEHRGKIIKTTGDGMLVEFASAVDAVRCAVEIQRGMAERNAGVPQNKRVEFRVGINIGDIIHDDNDIFGDGVNIAARMEGLAEPGGICVSQGVRDPVRDKLGFTFEEMGEQTVKNIDRPIKTYRVRFEGAERGEPEFPAMPSPRRNLMAPIILGLADLCCHCDSGWSLDSPHAATSPARHCALECALAAARQALDRRAAVHQHRRRCQTGAVGRRHHRGRHYRSLSLCCGQIYVARAASCRWEPQAEVVFDAT